MTDLREAAGELMSSWAPSNVAVNDLRDRSLRRRRRSFRLAGGLVVAVAVVGGLAVLSARPSDRQRIRIAEEVPATTQASSVCGTAPPTLPSTTGITANLTLDRTVLSTRQDRFTGTLVVVNGSASTIDVKVPGLGIQVRLAAPSQVDYLTHFVGDLPSSYRTIQVTPNTVSAPIEVSVALVPCSESEGPGQLPSGAYDAVGAVEVIGLGTINTDPVRVTVDLDR